MKCDRFINSLQITRPTRRTTSPSFASSLAWFTRQGGGGQFRRRIEELSFDWLQGKRMEKSLRICQWLINYKSVETEHGQNILRVRIGGTERVETEWNGMERLSHPPLDE